MNKRLLSLFLVVSIAPFHAQAQAVPDVVSGMKRYFDGLTAIHAEVTIDRRFWEPYLQIEPGLDLSIQPTFAFNYWESGSSWKYELYNQTKGHERFIARHAHTTDLDQYFDPSNDVLFMEKSNPLQRKYWLNLDNAMLQPFGFLSQDTLRDPGYKTHMPTLADLTNPTTWASLANATLILPQKTSSSDLITLVLPVKGVTDKPDYSSQYTYEVYLSKKYNYYPTGFRKRNKAGVLVQEVYCTELDPVVGLSNFVYPKQVTTYEYTEKGQLIQSDKMTINKVELNSILPTDDMFSIDPASARFIYDGDKKTLITVPN